MISKLDKKLIASLKKLLANGYYTNSAEIETIILAIKQGKVSITRIVDEHSLAEDLEGDMFCPKTNPSIDPAILKKEKKAFKERVRNSGVWTIVSRYWTGRHWEDMDNICHNSLSGFVSNDFFGSGYELQLIDAALTAYNEQALDANGFVIDPFLSAVA